MSLAVPGAARFGLFALAAAALFAGVGPASAASSGRRDGLNLALVAFLSASGASIAMAGDLGRAVDSSLVLLPAALFYYLARYRCAWRHLRWIGCSFTLAALLLGCIALAVAWSETDPDPSHLMSRMPLAYFSVPNDLTLIALCVPLAIAGLSRLPARWRVWPLIAWLLPGLVAIVVYRSNAALLGLAIGLAAMALLTRNLRMGAALASLLAGVLVVDGLTGFALLGKFAQLTVWANRLPLWQAAWHMFLDAPLLGQGPGGFSVMYDTYASTGDLPPWVHLDPRHAPWAHSLYLELLAERGLLGLLAALAAFAAAARILWSAGFATGSSGIWRAALLAALLAYLSVGAFDTSLLRLWNLVFLSYLLASTGRLRDEAADEPQRIARGPLPIP